MNVCAHEALHYKGSFIHSEDTMHWNISARMIYDRMIRFFAKYERVVHFTLPVSKAGATHRVMVEFFF